MASPEAADVQDIAQIQRVGANLWKKESRTADMECPYGLWAENPQHNEREQVVMKSYIEPQACILWNELNKEKRTSDGMQWDGIAWTGLFWFTATTIVRPL
jgi:hypothetical protein